MFKSFKKAFHFLKLKKASRVQKLSCPPLLRSNKEEFFPWHNLGLFTQQLQNFQGEDTPSLLKNKTEDTEEN